MKGKKEWRGRNRETRRRGKRKRYKCRKEDREEKKMYEWSDGEEKIKAEK